MRAFAWLLVVVGILVALGGPLYRTIQTARLEEAFFKQERESANVHRIQRSLEMLRTGMRPTWTQVSPWPPFIGGLVVVAFGVLILAIRRPEPRERDDYLRRAL